jgi:hypothetical protein
MHACAAPERNQSRARIIEDLPPTRGSLAVIEPSRTDQKTNERLTKPPRHSLKINANLMNNVQISAERNLFTKQSRFAAVLAGMGARR